MILDLRLPGMDGLAVLRQVAERFAGTKVIIITAYGTVEAVVDAMQLGAVDFLQKPFEPQEVREIVGRVLALPVGGPRPLRTKTIWIWPEKVSRPRSSVPPLSIPTRRCL